MALNEQMKYRLAYLAMRILFDQKLSKADDPGRFPAVLRFLDLLADTKLADEAGGRKYNSQREKLDSFLDAEYDDEMLELVSKVANEVA